jgi:signal transduction histidine kinase
VAYGRIELSAQGDQRRVMLRTIRAALRQDRRRLPALLQRPPGVAGELVVGVLAGVAAIVVKAVFNALLGGDSGFIVLTGAAALAAWYGGFRGGLTALLVAGTLNLFVFNGPVGSPPITDIRIGRTLLFLGAGVVVTWVIATIRTSRDRLKGSLVEIAAMADDIERRDERLEMVLAASGTGFWEWDVATGALTWSETIFEQNGLDPRLAPPTFDGYVQTIHPDDRQVFLDTIEQTLASRDTFNLEFRLLQPDGSVAWTAGFGRVFRDADGRPIRMIGTGTNITEGRRLEAERDQLLADERRAGAFREAFIDVISHELRTPITTIFGLTQILARPGRVDDAVERVGLIDDIAVESERLFRLVEDLLVLTRAERGHVAVEAEPLELRRLLARVIEHEQARLPGLAITPDIPRDLPVVAGEETYVEQIVRNILSNAAKYTPRGTAVVVRAEQVGDTVAVRVLDDGPGIDQVAAERAFELFYRDPISARTVAGSGIGLFVCASLVEAMGGTIWARPRPEGGAEFGFTLRVLLDDETVGEIAAVDRPDPSVDDGVGERAAAADSAGSKRALAGGVPIERTP